MKNFTLSFILLLIPCGLFSTDCIPNCECETDWTLEVRGAYYQPSSKAFKKVYTNHLLDYQVEAAKRIYDFFEIWGGVSWANKHGHTRKTYGYFEYPFKDRTRISILPLSLGLKFIYPILPFVDIYAGAGVCYSFLEIRNSCKEHYSDWELSHSPFKKRIYRNDVGGLFKLGFQFAMSDSTFLDFFFDYYLQRFHLSRKDDHRNVFKRHIDCSGFKTGIGFGVYF
jgi:hypothetical protein